MGISTLVVVLGLASTLAELGEPVPLEVDGGDPIEVVVETKQRRQWAFATLADPRVQAFFRSKSSLGSPLFGGAQVVVRRPLVRAGTIKIAGAEAGVASSRAQRREARRFARELVNAAEPALEACYVDALARTPTQVARLTVRIELSRHDRGPVRVSEGILGDVFGNACVHGVLEFADAVAPRLDLAIEIPVWFWLQTDYGPRV